MLLLWIYSCTFLNEKTHTSPFHVYKDNVFIVVVPSINDDLLDLKIDGYFIF